MAATDTRWAVSGDINAFFGLTLDNLLNLVVVSGLLSGVFGFPLDFTLTYIIPGTALGVLVGDLLYTWLAVRLSRRLGRPVTAMPLGLDTPSTIGIVLMVLGPVYKATGSAEIAWQVGMASMFITGLVKLILSFAGDWIERRIPAAGLLGSLGGVGLALLAFFPIVAIYQTPIVGMVALGLVLYTLTAGYTLPGRVPGAFAAVVVGTLLYYLLGEAGFSAGYAPPSFSYHPALPFPTLALFDGFPMVLSYLPIAIPFGILTVVGGINTSASARAAGDTYRTRDVLLIEAVSTLTAGFCGGVVQSTPYIGHPAYKAMGARSGYTLATGLFIGLGGMLGLVPFFVQALPTAAVMPILVFIGLEIVAQAHHATPREHAPAVILAFLPSLAEMVRIELSKLGVNPAALPAGELRDTYDAIMILGHGFILTGMLWAAAAAHLIDRRKGMAALMLGLLAALTLVGLIHSTDPSGTLYLPWDAPSPRTYEIAVAYALLGACLLLPTRRERVVPK